MQEMQVGSLVGELDPTCLMAKKKQNLKQKQYCNKFNMGFPSSSGDEASSYDAGDPI